MKKQLLEKASVRSLFGVSILLSATLFLNTSCTKSKNEIFALKATPKTNKHSQIIKESNNDTNKRVIYLTFDDGPNHGTENLIKILNKRNVTATAFLIGEHASGSAKQKNDLEYLRKNSLIELANHSYTHAHNKYSQFYKDPMFVVQDFNLAKDSLKLQSFIARAPGRNIWRLNSINSTDNKASNLAANELQKAGYKLIGWDLEWKPTNRMKLKGSHQQMLKKVDSIFFNDLEKTSRHLVFLTHDQYLTNPDSIQELDLFIEKLQKTNRFVFRKISEYPKINEVYN